MYRLNITKYLDIGGYLNLDEERKQNIMEHLYSEYVDVETKVKVAIYEIFQDVIEKGLNSRNNIVLIFNSDIESEVLKKIEESFDMWDIEVEVME